MIQNEYNRTIMYLNKSHHVTHIQYNTTTDVHSLAINNLFLSGANKERFIGEVEPLGCIGMSD